MIRVNFIAAIATFAVVVPAFATAPPQIPFSQCSEVFSSKALVTRSGVANSDVRSSVQLLEPKNDDGARLEPHFGRAFEFSERSRFALIRHEIYPNAEHVTLRSLETGESVASVRWKSNADGLRDIEALAFDAVNRTVVALAQTEGDANQVIVWKGDQLTPIENFEVAEPSKGDFEPFNTFGSLYRYRSEISMEHPYYTRGIQRVVDSSRDTNARLFTNQIVNWREKKLWTFEGSAVNTFSLIQRPISAKFEYVAVVQKDKTEVRIYSFQELSKLMDKKAGRLPALPSFTRALPSFSPALSRLRVLLGSSDATPSQGKLSTVKPAADTPKGTDEVLYGLTLRHTEPVKTAILSPWAPFIVTQTASGLHIWHAKTGQKIGQIRAPMIEFKLLPMMGLLAYTDGAKNVVLYSLFKAKEIATIGGFSAYALGSRVENRRAGLALIRRDDGSVVQIKERFAEGSIDPSYQVSETGVISSSTNGSDEFGTSVRTDKGIYFVHANSTHEFGSDVTTLHLRVYLLNGMGVDKGRQVAELTFPMKVWHADYRIDPTGQDILYTSSETTTGLIHIVQALKDHGL